MADNILNKAFALISEKVEKALSQQGFTKQNVASDNSDEKVALFSNDSMANSVEPVFYIKDFGIGMTEEEIIKVFGTYGASNKRNDNTQIGGLGLGAKTPFAYKENGRMFTVESCKNGIKSTVVFYKNSKDLPCKKRLGTEPCDNDTGTKVSFSVAEKDFSSFIRESVPVFLFAMQMPEILGGVEKWLSAAGFNSLDDAMVVREYLKNTLDIT